MAKFILYADEAVAAGRDQLLAVRGETDERDDIAVPEAEIERLHGLKIIPGMPVEAFIQTESRTVLSYLLKPFTDQLMRTFRES